MSFQLLNVKGLTKKYGVFFALHDVSLELREGEIVGLLGHNGAGKTTLIKCIMGTIQSYTGKILLRGSDIRKSRNCLVDECGFLLEPSFWGYLTAYENLKLFALTSNCCKNRIDEVLQLVSLKKVAHKKVSEFSFGMKQRLGLAQALLKNPKIIILDEPTVGLDPMGIRLLKDMLVKLSKMGVAILFSSHQLHEVTELCDRIIMLHSGEVIYDGSLCDIIGVKTIILKLDSDVSSISEVTDNTTDVIVESNIIKLHDSKTLQYICKVLSNNNIEIVDIEVINSDLIEEMLLKGKGSVK